MKSVDERYGGYTTGADPHWPELKKWLHQNGWPELSSDEIYDRLGTWFRPAHRCEIYPDCPVCKSL